MTQDVPVEHLEAMRAALIRHCYRMLGSAGDSEDAAQETLIRAHERRHLYDPARGALSTWLHRIATRICLDRLRGADRRTLLAGAEHTDGSEIGVPLPPHRWIEPMPGGRLFGTDDPADTVVERESVRLAFVALLQHLPPRQRAVLVLRDVLALSAAECAEILDTSTASVTSALQRAREKLERHRTSPESAVSAPERAHDQDLLRSYIAAFEAHDVDALTGLLRDDMVTSMPPFAWWIRGGARAAGLMATSDACAADRLVPVDLNGGPGFGQYRPDAEGVLRPFALVVLETDGAQIARITTFLGVADRFAAFGLPDSLSADR